MAPVTYAQFVPIQLQIKVNSINNEVVDIHRYAITVVGWSDCFAWNSTKWVTRQKTYPSGSLIVFFQLYNYRPKNQLYI